MQQNYKLRRRWTAKEILLANTLRGKGKTDEEIAQALGRTLSAVEGHFRWHAMAQHERDERAERIRRHRKKYRVRDGLTGRRAAGTVRDRVEPMKPDAQALAERDIRMRTPPRDLTAFLLGDPLPGRSALDRH